MCTTLKTLLSYTLSSQAHTGIPQYLLKWTYVNSDAEPSLNTIPLVATGKKGKETGHLNEVWVVKMGLKKGLCKRVE